MGVGGEANGLVTEPIQHRPLEDPDRPVPAADVKQCISGQFGCLLLRMPPPLGAWGDIADSLFDIAFSNSDQACDRKRCRHRGRQRAPGRHSGHHRQGRVRFHPPVSFSSAAAPILTGTQTPSRRRVCEVSRCSFFKHHGQIVQCGRVPVWA